MTPVVTEIISNVKNIWPTFSNKRKLLDNPESFCSTRLGYFRCYFRPLIVYSLPFFTIRFYTLYLNVCMTSLRPHYHSSHILINLLFKKYIITLLLLFLPVKQDCMFVILHESTDRWCSSALRHRQHHH